MAQSTLPRPADADRAGGEPADTYIIVKVTTRAANSLPALIEVERVKDLLNVGGESEPEATTWKVIGHTGDCPL